MTNLSDCIEKNINQTGPNITSPGSAEIIACVCIKLKQSDKQLPILASSKGKKVASAENKNQRKRR